MIPQPVEADWVPALISAGFRSPVRERYLCSADGCKRLSNDPPRRSYFPEDETEDSGSLTLQTDIA